MAINALIKIGKAAKKVLKEKSDVPDRPYSDIPLKTRHPKLATRFLKDHGFDEFQEGLSKPKGDYFKVNDDGSIVAFSGQGSSPSGGKTKYSRKTFKNPTLKSLRNWMGYSAGGVVNKKDGGWIESAIKKPGSLRKTLGVKKGETIPKAKLNAAAKEKGVTGQRARLAKTLKGFKNGGMATKWENKWG
tara:strand:+ start:88 stop:651 length:564 start_codon:yes stop_codon:yes gene_type:complete